MKNNVRMRRILKAEVTTSQRTLSKPHIIKTISLVTSLTPGSALIATNLATLLGSVDLGRGTTTPGTGTTTTLATMITTITTTRVEGNTHPAPHAKRSTIPQTSATSRKSMI